MDFDAHLPLQPVLFRYLNLMSASQKISLSEIEVIPLFVLPPASPKINGSVERMNRIITEEFLHDTLEDSLVGLRVKLKRFIEKYNTFRPHSSLKGLTPLLYIKSTLGNCHSVSYVMN